MEFASLFLNIFEPLGSKIGQKKHCETFAYLMKTKILKNF
jgi:hypothetical protein